MVRMIASLKQWYACWYCLSWVGYMRGGKEGVYRLNQEYPQRGFRSFLLVYVLTISEYILL